MDGHHNHGSKGDPRDMHWRDLLIEERRLTLPPRCSRTRASKDSKMSMEGWWMVTITVRPLRDTFLMLCITIIAARASSPAQQKQSSQNMQSHAGCNKTD